jgi:hypothetical protein
VLLRESRSCESRSCIRLCSVTYPLRPWYILGPPFVCTLCVHLIWGNVACCRSFNLGHPVLGTSESARPKTKSSNHLKVSWHFSPYSDKNHSITSTTIPIIHHSGIPRLFVHCLVPPFLPTYHAYTMVNTTRILKLLVSLVTMRKSDAFSPLSKHQSPPVGRATRPIPTSLHRRSETGLPIVSLPNSGIQVGKMNITVWCGRHSFAHAPPTPFCHISCVL